MTNEEDESGQIITENIDEYPGTYSLAIDAETGVAAAVFDPKHTDECTSKIFSLGSVATEYVINPIGTVKSRKNLNKEL